MNGVEKQEDFVPRKFSRKIHLSFSCRDTLNQHFIMLEERNMTICRIYAMMMIHCVLFKLNFLAENKLTFIFIQRFMSLFMFEGEKERKVLVDWHNNFWSINLKISLKLFKPKKPLYSQFFPLNLPSAAFYGNYVVHKLYHVFVANDLSDEFPYPSSFYVVAVRTKRAKQWKQT